MDDELDKFFEDWENDNKNLKDFITFTHNLEYNGTNLNLDNSEIKRKKPLRASKYIKRTGNELF